MTLLLRFHLHVQKIFDQYSTDGQMSKEQFKTFMKEVQEEEESLDLEKDFINGFEFQYLVAKEMHVLRTETLDDQGTLFVVDFSQSNSVF